MLLHVLLLIYNLGINSYNLLLGSASLVTQDFADDVIKAVHQNEQIERKMANIILKGLPEAGKTHFSIAF